MSSFHDFVKEFMANSPNATLKQAKEAYIKKLGFAKDLNSYQEKLAKGLEEALKMEHGCEFDATGHCTICDSHRPGLTTKELG